jgi:hypothetical protein
MPSKRAVYERLKFELNAHPENGEQKAFYADVEAEQKERIKNGKRKERFVLVTDDPDLCSEFEAEKDRIFRRCKSKALMLTFMIRAWKEALSDRELDRYMAEEGPDVL